MATCLGVSLGYRSLGGASLLDLGDLVEQAGLARGVRGWGSAPKVHAASQGRVEHPRGREVGLLITTLIRERKQSWQGLGIF